ncbi:MAG: class I SAM-dependent methyltransferase, partial [Pirellulales bacterium]|nr:class I SAM-dependent methyltransferase [Pirellulales bacterium]
MDDTPAGPSASELEETVSLSAELHRLSIPMLPEKVSELASYRDALWHRNERLNLTRHTTNRLFASRDVLDSLAFAAALSPGEDVLDVGTGGGVPGVLLRILRPDVSISLAESIGKKAAAVAEIVKELELPIEVYPQRAEELFKQGHTFDTLVVRAVAKIGKLLSSFHAHWGLFRRMLVLKGPRWVDERAEARHAGLLKDVDLRKLTTYTNPD